MLAIMILIIPFTLIQITTATATPNLEQLERTRKILNNEELELKKHLNTFDPENIIKTLNTHFNDNHKNDLPAEIKDISAKMQQVAKQKDILILRQQTFIMDYAKAKILENKNFDHNHPFFIEAMNQFNQWEAHRGENSVPEKMKHRLYSFDNFFDAIIKLLKATDPEKNISKSWKIEPLERFKLWGTANLLNGTMKILGNLPFIRGGVSTYHYLCGQSKRGTDVAEIAIDSLIAEGHALGHRVTVDGDKIAFPAESNSDNELKKTRLFLLPHRSDYTDGTVFSTLMKNTANPVLVGNATQNIPFRPLANALADAANYIAVGKNLGYHDVFPWYGEKSTIQSYLQKLSGTNVKNVMIFPQGFVANFGETNKIRDTFSDKLLKTLLNNGFEVEIIPVAQDAFVPFFHQALQESERSKDIAITVGPAITPKTVKGLLAIGDHGEALLQNTIRFYWEKKITHNPPMGINEMIFRIDRLL